MVWSVKSINVPVSVQLADHTSLVAISYGFNARFTLIVQVLFIINQFISSHIGLASSSIWKKGTDSTGHMEMKGILGGLK